MGTAITEEITIEAVRGIAEALFEYADFVEKFPCRKTFDAELERCVQEAFADPEVRGAKWEDRLIEEIQCHSPLTAEELAEENEADHG